MLPIEPDVPKKKRISYLGIPPHESSKINQRTVIQCGLYTYLMQTLCKAMMIFDGIGIGLKDISVSVYLPGSSSSSLQKKIIITIHTGDEAFS